MEISAFLPEVYLDAPGVPEPVALNALRNALRELCVVSRAWSTELDPIAIVSGQVLYDLDCPYGSEATAIISATQGTTALAVTTIHDLNRTDSGWRDRTGEALWAVIFDPGNVRVYPTPSADQDDPLLVRVSLRPTLDASACDDLMGRYSEYLVAGALARLKTIPNKPWSDREAVGVHQAQFRYGINRAASDVFKGFSGESLTVTPRRFGL